MLKGAELAEQLIDSGYTAERAIGIVATTSPIADTRDAARDLGLDNFDLDDSGLSVEGLNDGDLEILQVLEQNVEKYLREGKSLEVTSRELGLLNPVLAPLAVRRVVWRLTVINKKPLPPGWVQDSDSQGRWWYTGPSAESVHWLGLRDRLELEGKLAPSDLAVMDDSTTRTLGLMPAPGLQSFSCRGLVMGYVQSGKTTNFMGLIAKAADSGYRLIIVLSGITNNLRDQTQSRLEESLVGDDEAHWHWLTHKDQDFTTKHNAQSLLSNPSNRLIAVVKKNKSRLTALYKWLNSANYMVRSGLPILIIDDECDQATVNTARQAGARSAINNSLRKILDPEFMPRAAYVGYSATPFANLLIDTTDEDGLYPKSFIVSLDKSKGYFGAAELFGRQALDSDEVTWDGVDIIRDIPNQDVEKIKPPKNRSSSWSPEIPESLATSIQWFIIAHSLRKIRMSKELWSTMMVHTSPNIFPQFRTADAIVDMIKFWMISDLESVRAEMQQLYEFEIGKAAHLNDAVKQPWPAVFAVCKTVIHELKVVVDNYKSEDRLNYGEKENPAPIIVVGGNTLSRGLTLEGLVSTFFLRTSNAYDSLMQMGRWFGYRPGYEDLQRIWLANEDPYSLGRWFRELAFVEDEIRDQLHVYSREGLTPLEIAVKIRKIPGMAITAAAKQRSAVLAQLSYSESRVQTILFDESEHVQKSNLEALSQFVQAIGEESFVDNSEGWPVAKSVSHTDISSFLSTYTFHGDSRQLQSEPINKYIKNLAAEGELLSWNIAIYSNNRQAAKQVAISPKINVRAATRAPLSSEKSRIDIKTLISVGDMVADNPELKNQAKAQDGGLLKQSTLHLLRKRDVSTQGVPLLGIYLIDRDSVPENAAKGLRKPLGAKHDLVGLFIVFPEAKSYKGAEYHMANIADRAELEEVDSESDLTTLDETDSENLRGE